MSDEKQPSFESQLSELEAVVKELESGDLPLERALALFEKGTELTVACRKQLEEAESRVEQLVKRGSQVVPEPLPPRTDS
ncbi:MAG: exodeoxyribonuclease VII small subunit [Bryobacteraceae bacterium]|nr:exodeoxyribonuclease VII small subunit [Bryobacteraceae bacterium]MDW8380101.1 exodeoxyribonuclease VII small subunit [Bryobacterales bacterium]